MTVLGVEDNSSVRRPDFPSPERRLQAGHGFLPSLLPTPYNGMCSCVRLQEKPGQRVKQLAALGSGRAPAHPAPSQTL